MNKLLEVINLSKVFRNHEGKDLRLWEKINFSLSLGENMSICGESGSGKSTLLLTLGGLEPITGGEILFLNRPVKENSYVPDIAYIFQHYRLIEELTAWDNVLLPAKIQKKLTAKELITNTEKILDILNLTHLKDRLPNTLSGGEQQRVAIARALVTKPKLLLADEPTGSLDEATGKKVMDLFFSVCKDLKTSFILVTHNRFFAKQTHKVFYLNKGTLTNGTC